MNQELINRMIEMGEFAHNKDLGITRGYYGLTETRHKHYTVKSSGHVCAIGACMHGREATKKNVLESFADAYKLSLDFGRGITAGFDGTKVEELKPTISADYIEGMKVGAAVYQGLVEKGITIREAVY